MADSREFPNGNSRWPCPRLSISFNVFIIYCTTTLFLSYLESNAYTDDTQLLSHTANLQCISISCSHILQKIFLSEWVEVSSAQKILLTVVYPNYAKRTILPKYAYSHLKLLPAKHHTHQFLRSIKYRNYISVKKIILPIKSQVRTMGKCEIKLQQNFYPKIVKLTCCEYIMLQLWPQRLSNSFNLTYWSSAVVFNTIIITYNNCFLSFNFTRFDNAHNTMKRTAVEH